MDELAFKAQVRLEAIQTNLSSGATYCKECLAHLRQLVAEALNNPILHETIDKAIENARVASAKAVDGARDVWRKTGIEDLPSPAEVFAQIGSLLKDRMWRRTAFIFVCGVVCGTAFGVVVGCRWSSKIIAIPHYRALHSLKDGTAVMVEEGVGATVRYPNDVVIKIHAFAVQPLDKDVLKGRGKRLRQFVKPRNKEVTVGRSFSGTVVEMGSAVTRLDIGDEVWGCISEWEGGAAQEMLAMPAQRVSRCPRALPPEGGASLPHCGSLALHNLQITGLNVHTAKGKRVLIVGAGSGSGCVMLQLLKAWGATTTSVCDPRARPLVTALGSQEVLTVDWCADDGIGSSKEANAALAEALSVDLRQFEPWDVICICRAPPGDLHLRPLLRVGGFIADLRSSHLYTDSLPSVLTSFYGFYITARRMFQWLSGTYTDVDFLLSSPLNSEMLDRLSSHVETGNLQTVVDKVYSLQDFELALAHACSMGAIGCTVVRLS